MPRKVSRPKAIQFPSKPMKDERTDPPNQPMIGINAWNRPKCQERRNVCRAVKRGNPAATAADTAKASIARAHAVPRMVSMSTSYCRLRMSFLSKTIDP